jgi:Calcium binding
MANVARDEGREERIIMEAVVDAYGPDEQAMGWYSYLEGKLTFPSQPNAAPNGGFRR